MRPMQSLTAGATRPKLSPERIAVSGVEAFARLRRSKLRALALWGRTLQADIGRPQGGHSALRNIFVRLQTLNTVFGGNFLFGTKALPLRSGFNRYGFNPDEVLS